MVAGADALGPRLAGELLLPGLEAAGRVAALGGVSLRAQTSEHCHGGTEDKCEAEHGEKPFLRERCKQTPILARPRPRFEGDGRRTGSIARSWPYSKPP